jgi:hypothetical protein
MRGQRDKAQVKCFQNDIAQKKTRSGFESELVPS